MIKEDETTVVTTRDEEDGEIWYFGYGPIVHPQVRQRRGVHTTDEQAAVLRDYRLTFHFGGAATIVPKIGFTVHGVLMKCASHDDWKKLKDFETGYEVREVDTFPYKANEFDDSNEDLFEETVPIPCYAFAMIEYDDSELEKEITKKPQERYLRLISDGMTKYGVDETYVGDEIMTCPYIPSRKEEDWQTFPKSKDRLPRMTFEGYQKMCKRCTAKKDSADVYFILYKHVLKLGPHDEGNPAVIWLKSHAHGHGDMSHEAHVMITDPQLVFAPTVEDMTERHYRWAENQTFEFLQQSGVTAEKVYALQETSASSGGRTGLLKSLRSSRKVKGNSDKNVVGNSISSSASNGSASTTATARKRGQMLKRLNCYNSRIREHEEAREAEAAAMAAATTPIATVTTTTTSQP